MIEDPDESLTNDPIAHEGLTRVMLLDFSSDRRGHLAQM